MTLSTKDQVVISDGLRLIPQDPSKGRTSHAVMGCAGYVGPRLDLAQMDPALFAKP